MRSAEPSIVGAGSIMIGFWGELARKRVCFGHQSVGADIMKALSTLSEGRLRIVESSDPVVFDHPVIAHFRVGQNRDPLSKCQDFSRVINGGIGDRVDVAFFKFCYVDITAHTDVDALFKAYQGVMESLSLRYPHVVFLHTTVPLRGISSGVWAWLSQKVGGLNGERGDQVSRHRFNRLLRSAYGESGRLFDLAELEATYPDGRRASFSCRGEVVPNLVSEYTHDGGHLNQQAAERIAKGLLSCLDGIAGRGELSRVHKAMRKDLNDANNPV